MGLNPNLDQARDALLPQTIHHHSRLGEESMARHVNFLVSSMNMYPSNASVKHIQHRGLYRALTNVSCRNWYEPCR